MELTQIHEMIVEADAGEMAKVAVALEKVAEEDAAGRIMARGFMDELNKLAEDGWSTSGDVKPWDSKDYVTKPTKSRKPQKYNSSTDSANRNSRTRRPGKRVKMKPPIMSFDTKVVKPSRKWEDKRRPYSKKRPRDTNPSLVGTVKRVGREINEASIRAGNDYARAKARNPIVKGVKKLHKRWEGNKEMNQMNEMGKTKTISTTNLPKPPQQ
jgi:hypothetical protein